MAVNKDLCNKVVELRKKYSLTRYEFSDKLKIGYALLSAIETGKREPSKTVISKILKVFSVNIFDEKTIESKDHKGNNLTLDIEAILRNDKSLLHIYRNNIYFHSFVNNMIAKGEEFSTEDILKIVSQLCYVNNTLQEKVNKYALQFGYMTF